MNIRKRTVGLAIATGAVLLAVATVPTAAATVPGSMTFGGQTRTWLTHVPDGYSPAADGPLPVVFALHPAASTAANFQASSGWDAKSNGAKVLIVYPNGGNTTAGGNHTWNSYDFSGSQPDDLGFLKALIARTKADHAVDAGRVYMTGFSNGAMMTNSFAAAHAGELAAIAPVSGGWITAYGGTNDDLDPSRAVPVWIWRGANETFETGGVPRDEQDRQQLAFWRAHNGNGPTPQVLSEGFNYTGTLTRTYTTSRYGGGDAPTWFTEVSNSSHVYQPGAADLIWDRFFATHSVPEPAGCLAIGAALATLLTRARRASIGGVAAHGRASYRAGAGRAPGVGEDRKALGRAGG